MTETTPDPEPEVVEPTSPAPPPQDPLRHSRTSGAWTSVVVAAVLLVLLIIFIAQNTDDVDISFLFWEGTAPLSVALLIATVGGVLITAAVGTMRIWQLRRRVRKQKS
ncbi:LapA family protein [Nocardioides sp. CN2-186]|uniref:LapA family protein n=1 Tax=Nocardioides tweenelious TaxID=3156607 RepID=UPI0032B5660C